MHVCFCYHEKMCKNGPYVWGYFVLSHWSGKWTKRFYRWLEWTDELAFLVTQLVHIGPEFVKRVCNKYFLFTACCFDQVPTLSSFFCHFCKLRIPALGLSCFISTQFVGIVQNLIIRCFVLSRSLFAMFILYIACWPVEQIEKQTCILKKYCNKYTQILIKEISTINHYWVTVVQLFE